MKKNNSGNNPSLSVQSPYLSVSSGAPDALSFEHFLPWIWKIMQAFHEQDEIENQSQTSFEGIRYSRDYYTKTFK